MAPGGKGSNQAAAAAKAGAVTRFVGHLGNDAYGPVVRNLLLEAGIDCTGLATSERPTAIAVIGVDEAGENAIIVASGANLDTHAGQVAGELLGPSTTVLCQNEIRFEATAAILARGKAAGARTILNLAPAGPLTAEVLGTLDVLVVNEIEARMAAGTTEGDPLDLARRIAREHALTCVVTLGAAGAIAVGPDSAWRVGSLAIEPVDTTGAGDAFVGVLAATLDAGRPMPEALHRASIAAGLACLAMGAQSSQPRVAEIDARLADLAPPAPLD
jgi:ribokinase